MNFLIPKRSFTALNLARFYKWLERSGWKCEPSLYPHTALYALEQEEEPLRVTLPAYIFDPVDGYRFSSDELLVFRRQTTTVLCVVAHIYHMDPKELWTEILSVDADMTTDDKGQTRQTQQTQKEFDAGMILQDAIQLAVTAHAGQFDRTGTVPYITHPMAVMRRMATDEDRICAVLHDVAEDTPIDVDDIAERLGLPDELTETLRILKHSKEEPYKDYIACILSNERAVRVKIADIKDNLSPLRASSITPDLKKRYKTALVRLRKAVKL